MLGFIGAKGGVGTSTTAVNVAALLAPNGFETIVIELQQGRPGTYCCTRRPEPPRGLNSMLKKPADAITPADLLDCLVEALSGLDLLYLTAAPAGWRALDAAHCVRLSAWPAECLVLSCWICRHRSMKGSPRL